ncbi:MAG: hypothetical protein RJB14_1422 [Pseudomonadota bacterium]
MRLKRQQAITGPAAWKGTDMQGGHILAASLV